MERVHHLRSSLSSRGEGRKRRIGIVGFGAVGQCLFRAIRERPKIASVAEVAFVWNRTAEKMDGIVDERLQLKDLSEVDSVDVDLIVEVAHPSISETHGVAFLRCADYLIGSPCALASSAMRSTLAVAANGDNALYVPAGALWGAVDLQKMADGDNLASLELSMSFHPSALKNVYGQVKERMRSSVRSDGTTDGPVTLYAGPVRPLCSMAPNNVNTMAAAAVAAHTLGFDKVRGVLIADSALDAHVITVDARGHPRKNGTCFRAVSTRYNPAKHGAVTGSATYDTFISSMMRATGRGGGIHFC